MSIHKHVLFLSFYLSVEFLFRPVPVLGVTLLIGIDPCILQLETSFSATSWWLLFSSFGQWPQECSQRSLKPAVFLSLDQEQSTRNPLSHTCCFLRLMKHLQSLEHLDGSVLCCRDLCPSPSRFFTGRLQSGWRVVLYVRCVCVRKWTHMSGI